MLPRYKKITDGSVLISFEHKGLSLGVAGDLTHIHCSAMDFLRRPGVSDLDADEEVHQLKCSQRVSH